MKRGNWPISIKQLFVILHLYMLSFFFFEELIFALYRESLVRLMLGSINIQTGFLKDLQLITKNTTF